MLDAGRGHEDVEVELREHHRKQAPGAEQTTNDDRLFHQEISQFKCKTASTLLLSGNAKAAEDTVPGLAIGADEHAVGFGVAGDLFFVDVPT